MFKHILVHKLRTLQKKYNLTDSEFALVLYRYNNSTITDKFLNLMDKNSAFVLTKYSFYSQNNYENLKNFFKLSEDEISDLIYLSQNVAYCCLCVKHLNIDQMVHIFNLIKPKNLE